MDLTTSILPSSKRDRIVILAGLIFISVTAWIFTAYQAWVMGHMNSGLWMLMPRMSAWGPWDLWVVFVMWAVMMVAMMVPSVTPMVLTFATVNHKRRERDDPYVPTWIFLSGYLMAWTGFSVLATVAQWLLHAQALINPMMVSTSSIFSGSVLIASGVFQFTPFKNACLHHCRTPFSFLMTNWREGPQGTLLMGLRHGLYCTGCCWALMALLFALGVMNLLWIAVVSVFVLLEKVARSHWRLSQIIGVVLILWGAEMILAKFTH